ncbi:MAG: translation initiation factor [Desulfobacteraceae bacterium 4572_35.1]|nr:MAG: translation initiation factor [Desulfobacteraceae bacterium 4572_35.1]
MANNGETRLVYSSEHGKICPECNYPKADCRCNKQQHAPVGDGVVRVNYVTKGRKGKGVTVITGIPMTQTELKVYAKDLKKRCGSGGTIKDGIVEIQGDQRSELMPVLMQQGWVVKRCGG